ncbi:Trm112 family protein [Eionea flava]
MDKKLIDVLVCPVTKSSLQYDKENQELISVASGISYPIRDEIPVMLESESRTLSDEEISHWKSKQTSLGD